MALPTSDNTVNVTRLGSILSTLWNKIKNKFATKADLASPTFTGTPTMPTTVGLGQAYVNSSGANSSGTYAITASNFSLSTGGVISIRFTENCPASAKLNVNSKGSKDIYFRNAAIDARTITNGDIATFQYDGTRFQLLSTSRATEQIAKAVQTTHLVGASGSVSSAGYVEIASIKCQPYCDSPYTFELYPRHYPVSTVEFTLEGTAAAGTVMNAKHYVTDTSVPEVGYTYTDASSVRTYHLWIKRLRDDDSLTVFCKARSANKDYVQIKNWNESSSASAPSGYVAITKVKTLTPTDLATTSAAGVVQLDNTAPLPIGTASIDGVATGKAHVHDGIESIARASVTNIDVPNDGSIPRARMTLSQVTSQTTEGTDPGDGYVLNLLWDNAGNWDTQIYVPNSKKADKDFGHLKVRYKNESSTWGDWEYLPGASVGALLTSSDNLNNIVGKNPGEIITYRWDYSSCPVNAPYNDKGAVMVSYTNSTTGSVSYQVQVAYYGSIGMCQRTQNGSSGWSNWSKILTASDIAVGTSNGQLKVNGTDITVYTHPTQTAYSAKGTATKVPQITTDSTGHVTNIEEVDIGYSNSTDLVVSNENNSTPFLLYEISNVGLTQSYTTAVTELMVYLVRSSATAPESATANHMSFKVSIHWQWSLVRTNIEGSLPFGTVTAVLVNSATPAAGSDVSTLKIYLTPENYVSYRVAVTDNRIRGNGNLVRGTITKRGVHEAIPTASALVIVGTTNVMTMQTKENLITTWNSTPSDANYPSEKLVKTSLDSKVSSIKKNGSTITPSSGVADIGYMPVTEAQATATVQEVIQALRVKPGGRMGSVQLNASTVSSTSIPAAWYNYIWIPHRNGAGGDGSDNPNFGTLILTPMTSTPDVYVIEGSNLHTSSPTYRIKRLDAVTAEADIATGDKLLFSDASDSSKTMRMSTGFDTSVTTTMLRRDGTFARVLYADEGWGGAFSNALSPFDNYAFKTSNVFFGAKPSSIRVEYSNDGGTTWTDYGCTDDQKVKLFSQYGGASVYCGKNMHIQPGYTGTITGTKDLSNENIANQRLRITICDSSLANIGTTSTTDQWFYGWIRRLGIYMSTQSAGSGAHCVIDYRTRTNFRANANTWVSLGDFKIQGDSGWNSIPVKNANVNSGLRMGNGGSDYAKEIRFTIWSDTLSTTPAASQTGNMQIQRIVAYGELLWTNNSTRPSIGNYGSPCTVDPLTGTLNLGSVNFTARELSVDLSSTSTTATSFNGTANVSIKNTGTLPVSKGGTGKTTAPAAEYNILSNARTEITTYDDDSRFLCESTGPSEQVGIISGFRKASTIWNYIMGKISSVLGLTATNYGGTADTATKVSGTQVGQDSNARHLWFSTTVETQRGYIDSLTYRTDTNTISANISGNATTATTATNYNTSSGNIKTALDGKSSTSHTHSVSINGSTKTIAASGGTAVDLGTYKVFNYAKVYTTQTYNENTNRYILLALKSTTYTGNWEESSMFKLVVHDGQVPKELVFRLWLNGLISDNVVPPDPANPKLYRVYSENFSNLEFALKLLDVRLFVVRKSAASITFTIGIFIDRNYLQARWVSYQLYPLSYGTSDRGNTIDNGLTSWTYTVGQDVYSDLHGLFTTAFDANDLTVDMNAASATAFNIASATTGNVVDTALYKIPLLDDNAAGRWTGTPSNSTGTQQRLLYNPNNNTINANITGDAQSVRGFYITKTIVNDSNAIIFF